jgi:enoyl-CoA hydratase/carnithine racemase
MFKCRKPTIAALNGSAAGVGMTMTLTAAIRVAHASSKYVFPFAARGIIMESASSYFLPRLIGYSAASYLLTTGEAQRGDSRFLHSLFHEVLEDRPAVLRRALELATSVAQKTSGLTGFLSRELIWRGPPSPEEAHLLESQIGFYIGRNRFVRSSNTML